MADPTHNDHSMAPGFLVASPRLDGSPFERAVILLVHHDQRGAMGYIINKPVDVDFGTLIASVNEEIEDAILADRFETTVYFGGPVRIEQLWVIYNHAPPSVSMPADVDPPSDPLVEPANLAFSDQWTLSASGAVIEDFALHPTDNYFMPVLGYAGWGAGQLESEIEEGSWLVADFDDSLIFECAAQNCWDRALAKIGVDPTAFLDDGQGRLRLR